MKSRLLFLLPFALLVYEVRFHIGPFPTTLLELIILATCGIWLFSKKNSPHFFRSQKDSPFFFPMLLFLFAGIISVLVAPNHISALGLFRAYFIEPILVFMMLRDVMTTKEDSRHLAFGFFSVIILITIWTILQRLGVIPIPAPWNIPPTGIRTTGPFLYPNAVALFVVPIGALCISYIIQGTNNVRRFIFSSIGFSSAFLACALAQSDGGMIALLSALMATLLFNKKTRVPALLISSFLIISALSFTSIREPVFEKIFFRDWSGKVRLVMWDEARTMLVDHPLFGAGLGAYPDVIAPYHHAEWMEIFQYPHNILLTFWSELGLLGVISFSWILIRWYRSNPTIALPVITAILVHGLVDVPYFKNDLAILFWIFIAYTIQEKKRQSSIV
ncbi:MAG: O-antigen ligase family protein [bacterium]|nr:O-antigen ligase family protein [bacterium]